jgi:hypothetical protein
MIHMWKVTVYEKLEDFSVNFRILQLKNIQTTVICKSRSITLGGEWGTESKRRVNVKFFLRCQECVQIRRELSACAVTCVVSLVTCIGFWFADYASSRHLSGSNWREVRQTEAPSPLKFSPEKKKHGIQTLVTDLDGFERNILRWTNFRFYGESKLPAAEKLCSWTEKKAHHSSFVLIIYKLFKITRFKYRKTNYGRKFFTERWGNVTVPAISKTFALDCLHNVTRIEYQPPLFLWPTSLAEQASNNSTCRQWFNFIIITFVPK